MREYALFVPMPEIEGRKSHPARTHMPVQMEYKMSAVLRKYMCNTVNTAFYGILCSFPIFEHVYIAIWAPLPVRACLFGSLSLYVKLPLLIDR